MEWIEFCEKTSRIMEPLKDKLEFRYDNDAIYYIVSSQEYKYTIKDFDLFKKEANKFDFEKYSIYDGKSYETIVDTVDMDSRRFYRFVVNDKISDLQVTDVGYNITYSIQEISDCLFWHIIKHSDFNNRVLYNASYLFFERNYEVLSKKNFLGLLKTIIRLPMSLCIKANTKKSREQFENFTKSYLFNFAFNFDIVLKSVTKIEELFPKRFSSRMRKNKDISEFAAPQLSYIEPLVEQYYMALTSEDPFVKFIGFYHIMEYFYEEVYNADVFKSVQKIIQNPGFSPKRTKDIVKIVELIKKKTRQNKEEFQGSELEALELTLKEYVDINNLINEIMQFDNSLLDYYKFTEVTFSKGDTVDLRDVSNEKMYKKLASRIYKTRNALVHSKSNEGRITERGVYSPFKNGSELMKEIPLMRYISEEIIINKSTPL